jgi:hypothetical protein
MTQRDMAGYLNIDVKTMRNWRKNKPNLYKIIMLGFGVEDMLKQSDKNNEELKKLVEDLAK